MIEIKDKTKCSGCTACAEICPVSIIKMKSDQEGFRYPVIDEKDKCIQCNLCVNTCPVINPVEEVKKEQEAYLVQHIDESIRLDSAAGGGFTAIAEKIIDLGGVVFGASYTPDFQVEHSYAEQKEELKKFRNSKYVQSNVGDAFKLVKKFLNEGRWVCFSGTPCQLEGLNRYLKKDYEKLIAVDVVCHGIPSPLIWNKYLETIDDKESITNIRFRDKYYGYKYSTMSYYKGSKNIYHAGAQKDQMLRAFFDDICDRPICYDCPFKKRYRLSDFTIWDCFSVYDFDQKMDDDKGTTRILIHSQKGKDFFHNHLNVKAKQVEPDRLVTGVKEMFESVHMNPKRAAFFEDATNLSGRELFDTYYPVTAKVKIKTMGRLFLVQTNLYSNAKKLLNKMRGR